MREFSTKEHVFNKLAKLRCTKRRASLSIPPKPIPILEPISIPVGKCSGKPRAIRFVTDTLCGSRNKAGFQEKCYVPTGEAAIALAAVPNAMPRKTDDARTVLAVFIFPFAKKLWLGIPAVPIDFIALTS
jgi:hypothetical protein